MFILFDKFSPDLKLISCPMSILDSRVGKQKSEIEVLKVRQIQNEFLRLSFLPKCQPKNFQICSGSLLEGRAEIWKNFGWHVGRNDDLINSF